MSETGVGPAPVTIEEALDFIDHLRLRDWSIGIDQDLAIRRVFKESASTREATPERVKVWLAATLAHDPREQNAIFVLFDDWLAERRRHRQQRIAPRPATLNKPPARERRGLAVAGTAVIVVVVLLFAWIFYRIFFTPAPLPPPPIRPNPEHHEPVRKAAEPQPAKPLEQPVQESHGISAIVVVAAVIVGTAGLGFAALLFFRHGRRMQLRAAYGDPEAFEQHMLSVSGKTEDDALMRTLWRELRVLRPIDATDLDVEQTIDATLRSGGCFAPVYKARKRSPEYVMLIDRVSPGDHLSAISEALVEHLREGDVPLTSYTFHADPRVCWNVEHPEEVFSLRELAALHHDDRLILLTDGAGLIDPYRGKPYRWVEWFSAWSERAIVTPVPRHDRGARERALGEAGFAFVTAADHNINDLASALDNAPQREGDDELDVPGIPRIIARDPRRWLDRESPGDEEVRTMRRQLRASVGARGYRWLCACAVYPALDPRLTRHVGKALGITEQPLLLAISRLPWFRDGRMPEWARLVFIADLGEGDEKIVREALGKLIDSCLESLQSGFALPVSTRVPWLQRVLRRMRIRDASAALPIGSDFRDRVFLDFMDGRKPSPLQFEVKEFVAAMLKRRQADAQPLRKPAPVVPPTYGPFTGAARTLLIVLSYLGLLALIPRLLARRRDPDIVWHASNGLAMIAVPLGIAIFNLVASRILTLFGCVSGLLTCLFDLTYLILVTVAIVRGITGRRLRVWLVAPLADAIAGVKRPAPLAVPPAPQTAPQPTPQAAPRRSGDARAAAGVIITAALVEWIHANVLIGAIQDAFAPSMPTHRLFAIVSLLLSIPAAFIADRLRAHSRSAFAGLILIAPGALMLLLQKFAFAQFLGIASIAIGSALVRPSLAAHLGNRFSTSADGPRFYAAFTATVVAANWLGSAIADAQGIAYLVAIAAFLAIGSFVVFAGEPQRHESPLRPPWMAASWRNIIVFAIAFPSFALAIGLCRVTSHTPSSQPGDLNFGMGAAIIVLSLFAIAGSARGKEAGSGLPRDKSAIAYGTAVAMLFVGGFLTVTVQGEANLVVSALIFFTQILGASAILLALARMTDRRNRATVMAIWLVLLDTALLAPAQTVWPDGGVGLLLLATIAVLGGLPSVVIIAIYRRIRKRAVAPA